MIIFSVRFVISAHVFRKFFGDGNVLSGNFRVINIRQIFQNRIVRRVSYNGRAKNSVPKRIPLEYDVRRGTAGREHGGKGGIVARFVDLNRNPLVFLFEFFSQRVQPFNAISALESVYV